MSSTHRVAALTIAGSDSGGGAGVQVDLRTFQALGVHGTSAITAVTAQNLNGVTDVVGLPVDSVAAQIDAVLDGFTPRAVKTGMLWSAEIVERIASFAAAGRLPGLVVDPVMVATSGAQLLQQDAVTAYESMLFPHAAVITPNLDEAALLLGRAIAYDEMEAAATALTERYGCAVLLKGGHLDGDPHDLLLDSDGARWFRNQRVSGVNTHGSGCTLSAAVAAELAKGAPLVNACANAIAFLQQSLRAAVSLDNRESIIGVPEIESEAMAVARGYGKRLRRPDDVTVEPAHVYRPKQPT